MLTIQNIDKIVGSELDSAWLPNSKGWWVQNIEEAGDTYIFQLMNIDSNGLFQNAEIQLRREWSIVNGSFAKQYEMWAWNLENNMPEVKWCKLKELETVKDCVLWISYVLDKILPKN